MLELYLNNRKVDVDANTSITLNKAFDGHYFFGFSKVNSFSYSFKLPYTLNNRSVIGDNVSEFRARIIVDNTEILNGYAIVKKIEVGKNPNLDKYAEYTCNVYTKAEKSMDSIMKSVDTNTKIGGYTFSRDIDIATLINQRNGLVRSGKHSDVAFPYILNGYPRCPYDEIQSNEEKRWNANMNYFECTDRTPFCEEIATAFNVKALMKNILNSVNIEPRGTFFDDKNTDNLWMNGKTLDNALMPRLKFDFTYKTYEMRHTSDGSSYMYEGDVNTYENYISKLDEESEDSDQKFYGWKTLPCPITPSNLFYPRYAVDTHGMVPDKRSGTRTIVVKKSGWYHVKLGINSLRLSPSNQSEGNFHYDSRFDRKGNNSHWVYAGVMNHIELEGPKEYAELNIDNGSLNNIPIEFQIRKNSNRTDGDTSDDFCGIMKSNRLMNVGTHNTNTPKDNLITYKGEAWAKVDGFVRCAENAAINNDENMVLGMRFGCSRNQDCLDIELRNKNGQWDEILTENPRSLYHKKTNGSSEMWMLNKLTQTVDRTHSGRQSFDYTLDDSQCAIYNVNSFSLFEDYKRYTNTSTADTVGMEIKDEEVIAPYRMLEGFKRGEYHTFDRNPYPTYTQWVSGTDGICDGVDNASADTVIWLEEGDVLDLYAYLPLCQSWSDNGAQTGVARGYVSIDSLNAAIDIQCVSYDSDWVIRNTQQLYPIPNLADCLILTRPNEIINAITKMFNLNFYTIGTNEAHPIGYVDIHGNYDFKPIDISRWCDTAITIDNSMSGSSSSASSSDGQSTSNVIFGDISNYYAYVDEVTVQSPFGNADLKYEGNFNKGYASTIQQTFVYPKYDFICFGSRKDAENILKNDIESHLDEMKEKSRMIPILADNATFEKGFFDVEQWNSEERKDYDKAFIFGLKKNEYTTYNNLFLMIPNKAYPFDLSFRDSGSSILTRYYNINAYGERATTNSSELRALYQTYTIKAMMPMDVYRRILNNQNVIINGDRYYVTAIEKMNVNSNKTVIQCEIKLKLS